MLEHINDEAALREILPLLAAGGHLLVTVPAFPALWSHRDVAAGQRRRYRRLSLQDLLCRHGFEVRHMNYYQFLLFPVTAVSRRAGRGNRAWRDMEDLPPSPVNPLFHLVTQGELALSAVCRLPFGSSLVAAARKRL